ncbi:MAG: hypothetical protein KME09_11620 [Pleurocapsa minor HA4230-MV1]|jgi:hypothetical protein|nr:hypothetical protein [Pleurocapsa minor HA4230-MV1]
MNNKLTNNTLNLWREEGSRLIPKNYEIFSNLLSQASSLLKSHKYDAAAAYCQIASFHAQLNHCGFFVSPEIEQILLTIGQKVIPKNFDPHKTTVVPGKLRKILHVATNVTMIGGIPQLIRRWIQQDNLSSHSLALTKQAPQNVSKELVDLVLSSQGNIYVLNEGIGGFTYRAKKLFQYSRIADIVVIHTLEHDVIPMIAFANKEQSPPIIYVNHGDHWFWLGAGISDIVVNLRESGMRLSLKRRGIEEQRNLLLPTILEPSLRKLSRLEAKRQLGIDENAVMLFSIARVAKYRTINGLSFADAHVPLLKKYKQAILVVIGPGDGEEDWSLAIEQTQRRIKVLRQTKATDIFFQAADIYVDSYPFVSITSLLEAGSYSLPLVSRYPYSSDACEILGADMPGLDGNLIRVQNIDEYTAVLSGLVEDEKFRLALGNATKSKIEENHWGNNWQSSLNEIYAYATKIPRVTKKLNLVNEMFLGEPDIFLPSINSTEINNIFHWQMSLMPFDERLRLWSCLVQNNGFRNNPFNLLLSDWLHWRYYLFRDRILSFLFRRS